MAAAEQEVEGVTVLQQHQHLSHSPPPSVNGVPFSPLLVLLFLLLFAFASVLLAHPPAATTAGDDDCPALPHSNYLSSEDLDRACQHRAQWLRDRDRNGPAAEPTGLQRAYLGKLEATREVPASGGREKPVKKGRGGADPTLLRRMRRQQEKAEADKPRKSPRGRKFMRKEYRMMADKEREHFQRALNALRERHIDNVSVWDLHTLIHYPNSAPAAHWGPAFLPWHREFLRQFEAALQSEVPDLVGMPYWDSTLDHGLPEPADSVLWTDELMGNGNGFVQTGPFRYWQSNVLMPLSPVPIKRLFRMAGARGQDRLMSVRDADWIVSRTNFSELTFCHDKTFESMHGLAHVWVGGFMFVIRVSPNDPTFYLHHAYIDFLWEQFRQRGQSRKQRERDYAEKTCNKQHAFDAQMKPFNLRIRDGLSNDYTDFWFEYESVRHCTPAQPVCDSKFLFCDQSAWRCRSKVQLGGNCTGFAGTDICYQSLCIQNVCRLPATEGNGFQRRERRPPGVLWAKCLLLTDDSQPLTSGIAHVTLKTVSQLLPAEAGNAQEQQKQGEKANNNLFAFVQRKPEYPEMQGLLYLPLPNVREGSAAWANVTLEARDHYGRYCQSYCLNATTQKYQICEPRLAVGHQLSSAEGIPTGASNISFSHQIGARRFLDTDLSSHPRLWKVSSPFLVFSCQRKLLNSAMVKDLMERLSPPTDSFTSQHVWFRVGLLRKPRSELDLDELQVEAEDLDDPRELFISSVRRARSVSDQSVLFLRARNPLVHRAGVTVRVSIRRNGLRLDCDVRCNTEGSVLSDCDSKVRLHEDQPQSQEQVFTPDSAYLPYLGWRMIGHPSEWRLRMPYLSLYC